MQARRNDSSPYTSAPLWMTIEISRGVMLKGAGWAELWPQFAILTVMCLLLISVAIRKFSVRLD